MDADIEKKSPACTIIELVGFPIECFGAGNSVQLDLRLQNSTGTMIPRTSWMSSTTPFTVLYNIRPSVVEEVKLTFPADATGATRARRRCAAGCVRC